MNEDNEGQEPKLPMAVPGVFFSLPILTQDLDELESKRALGIEISEEDVAYETAMINLFMVSLYYGGKCKITNRDITIVELGGGSVQIGLSIEEFSAIMNGFFPHMGIRKKGKKEKEDSLDRLWTESNEKNDAARFEDDDDDENLGFI